MNLDCKSGGENLQPMIKMRSHLPVKKRMMMRRRRKVLLPKCNCSDKRSTRSETTGKSETMTLKSPHHYSLPSRPFTPTSSLKVHIIFQIFLSWLTFHILDPPVKILKKKHTKFKFYFISITMLQPFTPPKIKYKISQKFILNPKKTPP